MMPVTQQEQGQKLKRIMHVEDDDAHAEILQVVMSGSGRAIDVRRARDGEEAVVSLGRCMNDPSSRPHLIVLDLKLPKRSGLEVLKFIKGTAGLRGTPVVILTTSDAAGDRASAVAAHVNSYLVKPLDFNAFGTMIEGMLEYWLDWDRCAGAA